MATSAKKSKAAAAVPAARNLGLNTGFVYSGPAHDPALPWTDAEMADRRAQVAAYNRTPEGTMEESAFNAAFDAYAENRAQLEKAVETTAKAVEQGNDPAAIDQHENALFALNVHVENGILTAIENRAEQREFRALLEAQGDVLESDAAMAALDVAAFLTLRDPGYKLLAATAMLDLLDKSPDVYVEYDAALIKTCGQTNGLLDRLVSLNKENLARIAAREERKSADIAGMSEDAAKRYLNSPFLGTKDGITVVKNEIGYSVSFPFDRDVDSIMRRVPGALYNKAERAFDVPADSAWEMGHEIGPMRNVARKVAAAMEDINKLALESGKNAQLENGSAPNAIPNVSSYREVGKTTVGTVINVNAKFVAVISGFGKKDGAAFLSIHRITDLTRADINKGDKVGITYNAQFVGSVKDLSKYKSDVELASEHISTLGQVVDGVAVTDRGSKIGVAFEFNTAMMSRIRRIDGAAFNKTDKLWEVPADKLPFVLRGVQDMRHEFVDDLAEVKMLDDIAQGKIDNPAVSKAYTADGQQYHGKVAGIGERYLLQKTGPVTFKLHDLASLNLATSVDANLEIKYNKGVGMVVDQDKKRAQEHATGVGR